jgi:two-component system LytT family response regulator
MKVGVIDDEIPNRRVIIDILKAFCPYAIVVAEEGSVAGSITILNKEQPEVVFLDIELKNGTGFDVINGLNYKPEIIFTTAYSQYAINAIKVRAFDYLLKPINEDELIASLEKCKAQLEQPETKIEATADQVFFHLSTLEGRQAIRYQDIFYFEGSGSYTYCVTENGRELFSRNLGEVEKEIKSQQFFRTHHSYIVNVSKISKIVLRRNGQVFLVNGVAIPVAQRKIKDFKHALEKQGFANVD